MPIHFGWTQHFQAKIFQMKQISHISQAKVHLQVGRHGSTFLPVCRPINRKNGNARDRIFAHAQPLPPPKQNPGSAPGMFMSIVTYNSTYVYSRTAKLPELTMILTHLVQENNYPIPTRSSLSECLNPHWWRWPAKGLGSAIERGVATRGFPFSWRWSHSISGSTLYRLLWVSE